MRKMRKTTVIVLCLILVMSTFTVFAEGDAAEKVITIVHTNDIHARIEDGMGLSRIAAIIKDLEASTPNLLVMDAGDTFHGTTFATLVEGESIVQVMNAVGYDLMVPGNHDFNYGQDRLLELEDMADFDMVCANISDSDDNDYMNPYVIKQVDDVKVGIFGLATPETTYKTHPQNVEGLRFEDPVEKAEEMVEELMDETDVIIALAHLGDDETSRYTSIMVAEQVEGIDLIIDGHSHSQYKNGLQVGETLIVSTGEYAENLGVVDIMVSGDQTTFNARLITKDEAIAAYEEDSEAADLIEAIKIEQQSILAEVIGSTSINLDGERADVRTKETNLGNLITDAMVEITGADAALTNGGGIRASIGTGDITKEEIITVLPFGNFIVTKKLSGSDIKAALEHGSSGYPEAAGSFPHVSGISYAIDLNKSSGDRIVEIKINGEPLQMDEEYIIATNDFLAAGGDNYTMFADKETVNEYMSLDEAVMDYIELKGTVAPGVENRITVIEALEEEKVDIETEDEIAAEPEAAVQSEYGKYVVVSGDVLWKIAEKFMTTWQKLAEINGISNPHLIFPGQELLVP